MAAPIPLEIKVDVIENLGGTRYIYGTTKSGEDLIAEARDHLHAKAGETIPVGYRADRVLAFAADGTRLRGMN